MNQYVSFDFNIIQRNNSIFESLLKINFESVDDICIGTPYQCFKLYFEPRTIYSWVIDSNVPHVPIENKFNRSLSSTYRLFYEVVFLLPSNFLFEGKQFKDRIKIVSFETNTTALFLGAEIANEHLHPVIGLQVGLDYSSTPSFLENLVKSNEVNALEYTFAYVSSVKGRITFGHNDHGAKTFDFHIDLATKGSLPSVVSECNSIYLGIDKVDSGASRIMFDESFGFIQFPLSYHKAIMTILFGNDPQ